MAELAPSESFEQVLKRLRWATKHTPRRLPTGFTAVLQRDLQELLRQFDKLDNDPNVRSDGT